MTPANGGMAEKERGDERALDVAKKGEREGRKHTEDRALGNMLETKSPIVAFDHVSAEQSIFSCEWLRIKR